MDVDYGPALPPRLDSHSSRVDDASGQHLSSVEEPSKLSSAKPKKPSHSFKQYDVVPSSASDHYSDQSDDPPPVPSRAKNHTDKSKHKSRCRGKPNFRGSRGRFRPHNRGKRAWKPLFPITPPKPPSVHSRRSPPFFQKRLANKQMFITRVKHYHQWLHTAIPLKAKLGQISSDSVRIQDPSKRPSSTRLYPVSLSKNAIERVENVQSLGFYSRLFLVPKPRWWRPVIDLSRPNTFLHVEKFKMETSKSIRTSLVPGEWVSSIDLSDAYLHIPIHPNSRKYLRFCHRCSSSPPFLSD